MAGPSSFFETGFRLSDIGQFPVQLSRTGREKAHTSLPDVIDALLFALPTPFSV